MMLCFLIMAFMPAVVACTSSESNQIDPIESSLDDHKIDGSLATDARVDGRQEDSGQINDDAAQRILDMMASRDALVVPDGGRVVDTGVMPDAEHAVVDALVMPDAENADVDAAVMPDAENAVVDALVMPDAENAPIDAAVMPDAENAPVDAAVMPDAENAPIDAGVMPDAENAPVDAAGMPDAHLLDVDRDDDGVSLRQGDCDDDDPQRAPGFVDIINDGIDQDCDGFDLHSCIDDAVYQAVIVEEWRVCLSRFLDEMPPLGADVLAQLSGDLQRVANTLPPAAVARLREVRLWVEREHPDWGGAVYHPSPQWLINNGYPDYWARSVQIANARHYLDWTNIQPAMVLHELAHAWHHQVLGYGDMAVVEAFNSAMESGIYDNVEYAGGGFQRAYATTNVQEYFAELTEAYFWNNDFFPFNREQLVQFDVRGFELMESSWHHLDP